MNRTIRMYQAYNEGIAASAVLYQNFLQAPKFSPTRMTWIKPSFCWMAYRAGYGTKDINQARILAIDLDRTAFDKLLTEKAVLSSHSLKEGTGACKSSDVVVQWDPERDVALKKLEFRSLQLGMRGETARSYTAGEFIIQITDVTDLFTSVHERVLAGDLEGAEALCPEERVYELISSQ
ncbi:UNVERIFIED_CONTAM: hypothetical protein HDU68_003780 [Siphonaria sp. JEL0065]|nr:hypothetical protein HDU68_003780 [Siphonaria sp. JEL0065]